MRSKQPGINRAITNHTVDICKAHAHIHVGLVLFLPCSAGHSESCGQIRVKDGTGKMEYLRTFAISDALSLGARGVGTEAEAPRALWGPVWTSAVQARLLSVKTPSLS